MKSTRLSPAVCALALAALLWEGGPAKAGPITDPAGDFLSTYTGSQTGAFDVISASGTFDGTTFHLTATLAAPVSSAPAGSTPLYVWGINTGTGTNNFANIGNQNVRFNNVATLNAAGVLGGTATAGSINGARISVDIPLANLPSTGFAPQNYLWNLWPRDTSATQNPNIGAASLVSDFAPNNAVAPFDIVPEPTSLVAFAGVLGVAGWVVRRRKPA